MINPEALNALIPDINQQPPTTGVPAPDPTRTLPITGTEQMPGQEPFGFPPTTEMPTSIQPPASTSLPWTQPGHPGYEQYVANWQRQQGGEQMPGQEPFEFPFPEQWGDVSDFLSRMMETGMPTDVSGMGGALWDVYSGEAQRAAAEQLERAGLMGTRFGTPVGRKVGEEFARAGQRTTLGALPFQYQAEEAARGRQMGAAGGLTGLGGQYLYAPMNIAERMARMGTEAQAAQQFEIDPIYQEFLRTTPEASPWLQYALGAFGGDVPYAPQMYEPGWSSQAMDLASILGMMGMFNGWGG